jgi:hypothetical protein
MLPVGRYAFVPQVPYKVEASLAGGICEYATLYGVAASLTTALA